MQRLMGRPFTFDLGLQEHPCQGNWDAQDSSGPPHRQDDMRPSSCENDDGAPLDGWDDEDSQFARQPPSPSPDLGWDADFDSELFRQARHVKELLTHQMAHVQLLKMATEKAIELSSSTPQCPGLSAASALHGITAALAGSVHSAVAFAECFLEDVDALKAAECVGMSEEEQYEGPWSVHGFEDDVPASEDAGPEYPGPAHRASEHAPAAEHVACASRAPIRGEPPCWSPISGYSNPCWSGSCVIPLSGEDPFVDALAAKALDHSPPPSLDYHPDVTSLQWPTIVMDSLSSPPGGPRVGSRRVILDNLPPGTALAQVLRGIRCYGGIMAASIVPDCASGLGVSAVVECVYPDSAAGFVDRCARAPLAFAAEDGSVSEARVWLVPTASFAYSTRDHSFLNRDVTRAVAIHSFPADAVWDLIVLVGTRAVTEVMPYRIDNEVVLEFCSLFEADRAQRLIGQKWPGLHVGFVGDSSQGAHFPSDKTAQSVIGHVSPTHLADKWNCAPFNERTLAHYGAAEQAVEAEGQAQRQAKQQHAASQQRASQQQAPPSPSPSPTEKLAECLDISPSQLSSYLAERHAFPDTDYRVLGSNITLTRRAWSWRVNGDDDIKLLMANTLHEPEWADEWDRHFAARGHVNLRTWERYGMLARHRRDKAAEQGIDDWRVPQCGAQCEWGCCDIKAVPVPRVVERYLEDSNCASPVTSD